jgi:cobalamin biosynthesis protein CbiG
VDVRCVLGPASRAQARQMFTCFFRDLPHQVALMAENEAAASGTADHGRAEASFEEREAALEELAEQFAAQLPFTPTLTTAQLQAFLMTHRKSPFEAVAATGAWAKQQLQQAQQQEQQAQVQQPADGDGGGGASSVSERGG